MAGVTIKWVEKRRFVGTDSTRHSVVIAGSDPELGGTGVKPSDMVLLALGSCTAYDVVNILEKKRAGLTDLEVQVTAEQQADPPWTFTGFHVHFVLTGTNLSPKAVEDAITLSDEKYCCVAATLRLGVPVTHDFEIIDIG